MQKPATHHWTYEDYLELPDDGTRCEIIEGERLMTPAPSFRHQNALLELVLLVTKYVRENDLGTVVLGAVRRDPGERHGRPAGHPRTSCGDASRLQESGLFGRPISRSRSFPRARKIATATARCASYARHGVREYWIVDPIARRVEVHALEGARFSLKAEVAAGEVRSAVVLPGFAAPLADIFRL